MRNTGNLLLIGFKKLKLRGNFPSKSINCLWSMRILLRVYKEAQVLSSLWRARPHPRQEPALIDIMLLNLLFALGVVAQVPSTTTSVFDSSVPTDNPIPGDYTGAWRPQVHFSPPTNFMNDPNGCFLDANGTWHFYYQCIS